MNFDHRNDSVNYDRLKKSESLDMWGIWARIIVCAKFGCAALRIKKALSPVYSDTTQLNSTQLPVVDLPPARRRFWTSWPSSSSLWVMTSCMMQNSHEIREFVWLYGRIDIMESWTEELENKLIEL